MKEDFHLLVQNTFVKWILSAERSFSLLKEIGEYSEALQSSRSGQYNEFFFHIQSVLQQDVILSVSKIYDKQSYRFPTLCFEHVLDKIDKSVDSLPHIQEFEHVIQHLRLSSFKQEVIDLIVINRDSQFTYSAIVSHFQEKLKSDEVVCKINLLKTLRDKKVAHNEQVHDITRPLWRDVLDLMQLAKSFVGIFGWCISFIYSIEGDYHLTHDATRPVYALKEIFKELNIPIN